MPILSTIRLSLWGAAIVSSVITLGLSAHWLWLSLRVFYGYYFVDTVFAIATSALTLLTLPVFILIDSATDKNRNPPPTSMIMIEIGVVTVLWILWLTSVSLTVHVSAGYICSECHEYNATQAFSIIAWLSLMAYDFILLTSTIIAYNRGQTSVWSQSVKQTNFFAPRANVNAPLQGTPATGFVNPAGGFSPAPQYMPAGSPYTVPCMLVVVPQQQQQSQQPQYQLLLQQPSFPQPALFPQSPQPSPFPQLSPFQQSPLQLQPLQLQPFQQLPLQQQQFQQPPVQDGGSAPTIPPQPLQPPNTSPDIQPGHNQV